MRASVCAEVSVPKTAPCSLDRSDSRHQPRNARAEIPWPRPRSVRAHRSERERSRPASSPQNRRRPGSSPTQINRASPNRGTSRRISPPCTIALDEPQAGEGKCRGLCIPVQAMLEKECEGPLERREGQNGEEPDRDQPADARDRDRVDDSPPAQGASRLSRACLLQAAIRAAGKGRAPMPELKTPRRPGTAAAAATQGPRATPVASRRAEARAQSPRRTPCRSSPSPAPDARAP